MVLTVLFGAFYWSLVIRLHNANLELQHIISGFMECLTGGNMALYVNDNHILYYLMDAFRSIM